jgi:hypothetical protein
MLMTPANQAGTSPPRHQPAASASASGFARTPRRYHSRAHSFANQSIYSYGSAMNAGSFHLPQSAMVGGDFTRPMTGGRHTAPSTVGGGGGLSDRETMALLELQRVLYRGSGYCDENGRERDEVKSIEARRFIEQCLETDCGELVRSSYTNDPSCHGLTRDDLTNRLIGDSVRLSHHNLSKSPAHALRSRPHVHHLFAPTPVHPSPCVARPLAQPQVMGVEETPRRRPWRRRKTCHPPVELSKGVSCCSNEGGADKGRGGRTDRRWSPCRTLLSVLRSSKSDRPRAGPRRRGLRSHPHVRAISLEVPQRLGRSREDDKYRDRSERSD